MRFFRSLRTRIFLSMILLILGASVLIATVTISQYRDEAIQYQKDKLKRKEASIRASIDYEISNTTYPVNTKHIPLIFKDKIYELKNIHNTEINIYNLDGKLLKTSRASFFRDTLSQQIEKPLLDSLQNAPQKRYVTYHLQDKGDSYLSSYTYITDQYFKPLAILNLPYIEDDGFIERQLNAFLKMLAQVYVFLILAAVILAYFLSRYVTLPLKTLGKKMSEMRLDKANKKINVKNASIEITQLLQAYNAMVDELEESVAKLAASEREQAWREMAKQVAHEVKNPLTPMRLSIQSFERKFNPNDPNIQPKVKEFSQSLIQQIDTMSAIASAFSNFAQMPEQKNELLNIVEVVKLAVDIFNEDYINFTTNEEEIYATFDRAQLIRIITNLLKNASQATQHKDNPKIEVKLSSNDTEVKICISDNGTGISPAYQKRIFEPKFTTKSSGMGLGLGIIKTIIEAYHGKIWFISEENKNTTFYVQFPKKQQS